MKKTIKLIALAVSSLIVTACGSSDITTEELMKAVKQNVQKSLYAPHIKVLDVVLYRSTEDETIFSGNMYAKTNSYKIWQADLQVSCESNGDVTWKMDSATTGSFNFFDSVEGSVDLSEYRETAKTNMKLVEMASISFLTTDFNKSWSDITLKEILPYLDEDHNSKEKLRVGSYDIQIKNGKASYPGLTD